MQKSFVSAVKGRSSTLDGTETQSVQSALKQTRERMGKFFTKNQILGRKGSIGCVSLEISQRCNLDCSLCYLSSNSNDVTDLPLQEIF